MTFNDDSPRAMRHLYTNGGTLQIRDLYRILHDRLEYCRVNFASVDKQHVKQESLSEFVDIDTLCQTFCYEVEKALGLHPAEAEPPEGSMGPWMGGTTPPVSTKPESAKNYSTVTVQFVGAQGAGKTRLMRVLMSALDGTDHTYSANESKHEITVMLAEPRDMGALERATRTLHPGPRDKALAREELVRKLERVNSGKGYTAHYLAGALLEAMKEGLI